MFPSLRSPRTIMGYNVSATMCLRLPEPLATLSLLLPSWLLKLPNNLTTWIVTPPNSNTFSDWRRTCHVPWVRTNSHMIRQCSLKPRQICERAGAKQTISSQCFSTFELGGTTKHLTGPQWHWRPRGNKTHCFPWENLNFFTLTTIPETPCYGFPDPTQLLSIFTYCRIPYLFLMQPCISSRYFPP